LPIGVLLAALIPFVGCKQTPPNPNQGFTISTSIETRNSVGGPGPYAPMPGTLVLGQYVPNSGREGYVASYDGHTGLVTASDGTVSANYYVSDGIAPANWNHYVWMPSTCLIPTPPIQLVNTQFFPAMNEFGVLGYGTPNLDDITWYCSDYLSSVPQADSRFAIVGSVPTSVTLSGREPFSTQYGLPIMYVFSGASGTPKLAATVAASSVNSGGASATFPLPNSLTQGGYFFVTENMNSTGGYEFNSWNLYSIASSQTIAGALFGVSVATQITETINCVYVPEGTAPHIVTTTQCSQSSSNFTIPVVSLYSANQVLIGSRYMNVGANPTAVVTPAYTAGETSNTVSNSNGYTTTIRSGSLRAIVANSGSNTISVLDTLNDALLYNVTVGNQPVALAVSSDNSTVYVANYTDSTVTQVNLTAGTATATVAVGGKPTSVAITSAGTLWVGGAGFLTEINTGTMSVVATEPIAGITILTLGFSNSVNELVATAIDSGGHVYADEISPGAFHAGGAYTPVASNMVSSLGTRLIRGAQLQAFTATLAGASTISSNQVGAPPLVV
jgi:YVTN family beta-propeller protein